MLCLVALSCPTLCNPMDRSLPGSSVHGDSPGKKTWLDFQALLQVIFTTEGLNPGIPHCRRILYRLSHQGNPKILKWVAYPFSRGSSQPRHQTRIPCIVGGFFTSRATREAPLALLAMCPNEGREILREDFRGSSWDVCIFGHGLCYLKVTWSVPWQAADRWDQRIQPRSF